MTVLQGQQREQVLTIWRLSYRYAGDSDREQQRYECFSGSICERLYGIQEGQSYTEV